jgi:Tol biopolymer transport system component
MDLQGERKLVPVLNSPASERDAKFSPDGKWISYRSRETGTEEVFVTSFPTPGSRWQVSNAGASYLGTWSADGKNLRYSQGDKIFNVEVHNNGGKLEFSVPKLLLTLPPNLTLISILPDDKRILVLRPTGDTNAVPIDFILNWQHLVH